MDTKVNILDYKIKVWKYLTDLRNRKEHSLATFRDIFAVVGIIVSTFNVIYTENNDKIEWYLTISCITMPMLIIIFSFWFSMNNRVIAIIMGYIAGIEDSINEELGTRIFQYDSYFVWLYAPKFFPSNSLLSYFYAIIICFLTFICFNKMYNEYYYNLKNIVYITLYYAVYAFFIIVLVNELNTNPIIRKTARTYFHINVDNKEIDEMDLKRFVNYIPNISEIVKLYCINNR